MGFFGWNDDPPLGETEDRHGEHAKEEKTNS